MPRNIYFSCRNIALVVKLIAYRLINQMVKYLAIFLLTALTSLNSFCACEWYIPVKEEVEYRPSKTPSRGSNSFLTPQIEVTHTKCVFGSASRKTYTINLGSSIREGSYNFTTSRQVASYNCADLPRILSNYYSQADLDYLNSICSASSTANIDSICSTGSSWVAWQSTVNRCYPIPAPPFPPCYTDNAVMPSAPAFAYPVCTQDSPSVRLNDYVYECAGKYGNNISTAQKPLARISFFNFRGLNGFAYSGGLEYSYLIGNAQASRSNFLYIPKCSGSETQNGCISGPSFSINKQNSIIQFGYVTDLGTVESNYELIEILNNRDDTNYNSINKSHLVYPASIKNPSNLTSQFGINLNQYTDIAFNFDKIYANNISINELNSCPGNSSANCGGTTKNIYDQYGNLRSFVSYLSDDCGAGIADAQTKAQEILACGNWCVGEKIDNSIKRIQCFARPPLKIFKVGPCQTDCSSPFCANCQTRKAGEYNSPANYCIEFVFGPAQSDCNSTPLNPSCKIARLCNKNAYTDGTAPVASPKLNAYGSDFYTSLTNENYDFPRFQTGFCESATNKYPTSSNFPCSWGLNYDLPQQSTPAVLNYKSGARLLCLENNTISQDICPKTCTDNCNCVKSNKSTDPLIANSASLQISSRIIPTPDKMGKLAANEFASSSIETSDNQSFRGKNAIEAGLCIPVREFDFDCSKPYESIADSTNKQKLKEACQKYYEEYTNFNFAENSWVKLNKEAYLNYSACINNQANNISISAGESRFKVENLVASGFNMKDVVCSFYKNLNGKCPGCGLTPTRR